MAVPLGLVAANPSLSSDCGRSRELRWCEEWLDLKYRSLLVDISDDVLQEDNRKDASIRTFFVPGQQVAWKES